MIEGVLKRKLTPSLVMSKSELGKKWQSCGVFGRPHQYISELLVDYLIGTT